MTSLVVTFTLLCLFLSWRELARAVDSASQVAKMSEGDSPSDKKEDSPPELEAQTSKNGMATAILSSYIIQLAGSRGRQGYFFLLHNVGIVGGIVARVIATSIGNYNKLFSYQSCCYSLVHFLLFATGNIY